MIKLYGIPRSRTMRCLWMLEELGVPYENVPVTFTGGSRQPAYLKINPNGHVPALQDGDTVLWESLAINLYLARKFDKGLWPKSIEGEGHAYKWSLWAANEIEEPILTAMRHRMLLPPAERSEAEASAAVERSKAPLAVLESQLRPGKYLLGDEFTVADLNVAGIAFFATMLQFDLSNSPRLADWIGRCSARPAFAKVTTMV